MKLLTIAIPNYNYARYLKKCIDSVVQLDSDEIEILISDNCSTDNSWEIISSYTDSRIIKYRQDENIGLYANWNFLLNQSNAYFFKILQSDDFLNPNFFQEFLLSFSSIDKSYISAFLLGNKTELTNNQTQINLPIQFGLNSPFTIIGFNHLNKSFNFSQPDFNVLNTTILKQTGGYFPQNGMRTDLMVLIRVLLFDRSKQVIPINAVVVNQRIHGHNDRNNYTFKQSISDEIECIKIVEKAKIKHFRLPVLFWKIKISIHVIVVLAKHCLTLNQRKLGNCLEILRNYPKMLLSLPLVPLGSFLFLFQRVKSFNKYKWHQDLSLYIRK